MSTAVQTDIAILGGGIAGLWLLNRLRGAGYSAVLLTAGELGAEQTIASQGMIHGGMKPGSRDEPGTRLYQEQQFRDGGIQVLVATEAAGEGFNLQCCHILFNYDIPWNPNRLEQRMGRIHRYGQTRDCLIFNFVATNTIEGRVLQRLALVQTVLVCGHRHG